MNKLVQKSGALFVVLLVPFLTPTVVANQDADAEAVSAEQQASGQQNQENQEQQNQEQQDQEQDSQEQQAQEQQERQSAATDTGLAGETDTEQTDPQQSPADGEIRRGGGGRFIPSEQISQDLGVSFPVDI